MSRVAELLKRRRERQSGTTTGGKVAELLKRRREKGKDSGETYFLKKKDNHGNPISDKEYVDIVKESQKDINKIDHRYPLIFDVEKLVTTGLRELDGSRIPKSEHKEVYEFIKEVLINSISEAHEDILPNLLERGFVLFENSPLLLSKEESYYLNIFKDNIVSYLKNKGYEFIKDIRNFIYEKTALRHDFKKWLFDYFKTDDPLLEWFYYSLDKKQELEKEFKYDYGRFIRHRRRGIKNVFGFRKQRGMDTKLYKGDWTTASQYTTEGVIFREILNKGCDFIFESKESFKKWINE